MKPIFIIVCEEHTRTASVNDGEKEIASSYNQRHMNAAPNNKDIIQRPSGNEGTLRVANHVISSD